MRLNVRRPAAKAGAFGKWPLLNQRHGSEDPTLQRLLEAFMYLRTARIVLAVVLAIALCNVGAGFSTTAEAANDC